MDFSLKDISKQQLRKTGFLSSTVIIEKDMILLFKVDKDVILDNHNHPHAQLGYCFYGEFDFEVEGEHFDVKEGDDYLLDGKVYHSAVANSDYYSLDVKVILDNTNLPKRIEQNAFKNLFENDEYRVSMAELGKFRIEKVTYKCRATVDIEISLHKNCLIIVSKNCNISFGESLNDIPMEIMKIYELKVNKTKFAITTDSEVEVLVITY